MMIMVMKIVVALRVLHRIEHYYQMIHDYDKKKKRKIQEVFVVVFAAAAAAAAVLVHQPPFVFLVIVFDAKEMHWDLVVEVLH